MDRQRGQATVEWVALLLVAALILGAAAAHSSARDDRGLGREVAKRIAGAPREITAAAPAAGIEREARAQGVAAPPVRSPSARSDARLRGVARVAERAWIVCLGYRRWRQEMEHPLAPTESLPLDDALEIANDCLNPYSFLFGD
jgi:hypothetical protein